MAKCSYRTFSKVLAFSRMNPAEGSGKFLLFDRLELTFVRLINNIFPMGFFRNFPRDRLFYWRPSPGQGKRSTEIRRFLGLWTDILPFWSRTLFLVEAAKYGFPASFFAASCSAPRPGSWPADLPQPPPRGLGDSA